MDENTIGIAGLALGILGIVIGIVTYLRARERKQLDYEIVINTPLMGHSARTFQEELEVHFRGVRIVSPHLVIVRLINSGNRPVAPDDQIEHIAIDFSDTDVAIMTADQIKTNIPESVASLTNHDGKRVSLTPLLFNQGDWVAIRMLVDGKAAPTITELRGSW